MIDSVFRSASTRFAFGFWFVFTVLSVALIQFSQARETGSIAGLLKVGETHPVRELVESQIPGVPLAPDIGHDGQLFYVIALDLRGDWAPGHLEPDEDPSYRYRRIGYPAVSSLFGLLQGTALVWSMAATNAVAAGVAAGTTAAIAHRSGRTPWLALVVALNPGVWLSALLLTADNLALAAGMVGIWCFLRNRPIATVAALAVAALTKDVALLFALGLVGYAWIDQRDLKRGTTLLMGTIVPVALWYAYVDSSIGDVFETSGNLGPPLGGLIDSVSVWAQLPATEIVYLAVAIGSVLVAAARLYRAPTFWQWMAWPWFVVAILSTDLVWHLGNNAIRTLAPLVALTALAIAATSSNKTTSKDSGFHANPARLAKHSPDGRRA